VFFKSKFLDFFARVVAGLLVGMFFGFVLSEVAFQFLDGKETVEREPRRVDLVIPYGTAKLVEEGGSNRSIPSDMVFVEGDVLVVKNEDVVAHQLGPLFVPPSTSSVLELNMANRYSYECSFQPQKYMGLDVRPRVTGNTRLQAILSIGLPSGMMLAVYSYLIPARKEKDPPAG
jgi:hypothetical protein